MIISNLGDNLRSIELRMIERIKTLEHLKAIYKDLLALKEYIINICLIDLTSREIEVLDYTRFRVLELLYLSEIDLKEARGISLELATIRLKELYFINGGSVHDEL